METGTSNIDYISTDNSGSETLYQFIELCDSETQTETKKPDTKIIKTSSTQTDTNSEKEFTDARPVLKLVGNRNIAVSGFIQIGNAVALDDKTNCAVTGLLQLSSASEKSASKDDFGLTGVLQIGNPTEIGNKDSVAGLIQIGVGSPKKSSKPKTPDKQRSTDEQTIGTVMEANPNIPKTSSSCQTENEHEETTSTFDLPEIEISSDENWVTTLDESGLILTRSDLSSTKPGSSSQDSNLFENLLKHTTTSVISAGEGEDAGSYIVIKTRADLSAPGSSQMEVDSFQESAPPGTNIVRIDSKSPQKHPCVNQDTIFHVKHEPFYEEEEDIPVPPLVNTDGTRFYQENDGDNEVEFLTNQDPVVTRHNVDTDHQITDTVNVLDGPVVTEYLRNLVEKDGDENRGSVFSQQSDLSDIDSNSAAESLLREKYPKDKVKKAMEELNDYINASSSQVETDVVSEQSNNRLAKAHKYLTEYVQQIQTLKERSNKSEPISTTEVNQEITHSSENVDKMVSHSDDKKIDNISKKKSERRSKARTLSECEKVEAVEGLIQMSKAKGTLYPNARKQFDEALKAGMKSIQTDIETINAVEGLMEIGNTPPKEAVSTKVPPRKLETQDRPVISIKDLPYKAFRCVNCEQIFVNENEVVAVSRSADFRKLYMCHDCHSNTRDGFLHKCRLCGAGFQAIRALEKHFDNHDLKYIYRCDYCGKGFGYHGRNRFLSHERTHRGPNPCFCTICGMQFARAQYLQMHVEKTHKRKKMHFCEICGQFFSYEDQLRIHYRSQHFCYDTTSREASDFRCGICNEVYPSLYMLNTHLVLHTRLSQGFGDMFECLVCQKRFKKLQHLQKHHIRCHPDKDLPVYRCSMCNKTFQSERGRDAHMLKEHKDTDNDMIVDETKVTQDVKSERPDDDESIVVDKIVFDDTVETTEIEQNQHVSQDSVNVVQEEIVDQTVESSESRKTGRDSHENLRMFGIVKNVLKDQSSDNQKESSTEVILGSSSGDTAEPTILVEMKSPSTGSELQKSFSKMRSLLKPGNLAMLQKAKPQSSSELCNDEIQSTSVAVNSGHKENIVVETNRINLKDNRLTNMISGNSKDIFTEPEERVENLSESDCKWTGNKKKSVHFLIGTVQKEIGNSEMKLSEQSKEDSSTRLSGFKENSFDGQVETAEDFSVQKSFSPTIKKDNSVDQRTFPRIRLKKSKTSSQKSKIVMAEKEKSCGKEPVSKAIDDIGKKVIEETNHSISSLDSDDVRGQRSDAAFGNCEKVSDEVISGDGEKLFQIGNYLGKKTDDSELRNGSNKKLDSFSSVEFHEDVSMETEKVMKKDRGNHQIVTQTNMINQKRGQNAKNMLSSVAKENKSKIDDTMNDDNSSSFSVGEKDSVSEMSLGSEKEIEKSGGKVQKKCSKRKRKTDSVVNSSLNKQQKQSSEMICERGSAKNITNIEKETIIRKSSRKTQPSQKLIESLMDKGFVKTKGSNVLMNVTKCSDSTQEIIKSSDLSLEENTQNVNQSKSVDFQDEFLKYSKSGQNTTISSADKLKNDNTNNSGIDKINCSVILNDIGNEISSGKFQSSQSRSDIEKNEIDGTDNDSTWSKKFQEFISNQSNTSNSQGNKRTNYTDTDISNIDPKVKKTSKK